MSSNHVACFNRETLFQVSCIQRQPDVFIFWIVTWWSLRVCCVRFHLLRAGPAEARARCRLTGPARRRKEPCCRSVDQSAAPESQTHPWRTTWEPCPLGTAQENTGGSEAEEGSGFQVIIITNSLLFKVCSALVRTSVHVHTGGSEDSAGLCYTLAALYWNKFHIMVPIVAPQSSNIQY